LALDEAAASLSVSRVCASAYMPPQIEQAHQNNELCAHQNNELCAHQNNELGAPGPSHLGTRECITPIDSQLDSIAAPYTVNALGASIEVASPLAGAHQQRNIALAIAAAVELARDYGFHIAPHQIAEGVRKTVWPGRLERIERHDAVWILDVAHNPAGAWAVRSGLTSLLGDKSPRLLVFSCLRDKPITEMAQILFPLFNRVILTRLHTVRAAAMEDLVAAAQLIQTPFLVAESVAAALQLASKHAGGGPIIVCGSVYLVGEARSLLLAEGAESEGSIS
jgi:dihydrofolate synthase/folylpolyglutamate synthase